jgi:putative transcriptional regulator
VSPKSKSLNAKELAAYEAKRDIAAELLQSVRTLQDWEQGRKQPSGAARTLRAIASTNPKPVLAVVGQK